MRFAFKPSIGFKLKLAHLLFLLPLAFLFYEMVADATAANDLTRREMIGSSFIAALRRCEDELAVTGHELAPGEVSLIDEAQRRFGSEIDTADLVDKARIAFGDGMTTSDARAAIHDLIVGIANRARLTIDPNLDSYYVQDALAVKIPNVVERLAEYADSLAAGPGNAGMKSQNQLDSAVEMGGLRAEVARLGATIASASGAATDEQISKDLLDDGSATVASLYRTLEALRRAQSSTAEDRTEQIGNIAAVAQASLARLSDQYQTVLVRLLQARITRTTQALGLKIAIAVALFLIGVAFVIFGVEIDAIRPLRKLARTLHGLAQGKTDTKIIATKRRDEVGDLARAAQAFKESLQRTIALETKLRISRDGLVRAQSIGGIGSSEVDLVTGTATWSDELVRIHGIDVATIPQTFEAYLKLVHPDDHMMMLAMRERNGRGDGLEPAEYRIIRQTDREVRWIHLEHEIERDATGRPIKMYTTQQDVTEQRRMDAELRTSRDKMAEILRAMNIAGSSVILTDPEQVIVYVNETGYELLGLPTEPGAIDGKRLMDFQEDNEAYLTAKAEQRQAVESDGHWSGTLPWKRPSDGETLFIDVRFHRMPNGGFVSVAADATARVRLAEEERRHREREAQAGKVEALGNLAGGIAHDFNNLLGAVLGFGQFLMQDLPPGSDQRRFAERIVSTSERGRSLVRQILAFSRRSLIEETNVLLRQIITETQEMLRATLPSTTEILVEIGAPEATVFTDKGQLTQVLVNLCVNGSDALEGEPGSITISLTRTDRKRADLARLAVVETKPSSGTVQTWVDDDGTGHIITGGMPKQDCISLAVTDTGSGIPTAMLTKIFEPFVTTKEKGKGTGLGLAVVHRIVVEHGGAMVVTTREHVGTRFEIIMRLSGGIEETADQPVHTREALLAAAGQAASVLVVDDDEAYLAMVETALRRVGHRVQSTSDPREALKWIESGSYKWDVLVSDQTMPHIRGSDLVKSCKGINPNTMCIICTGFSSGLNEDQAITAGADGFMLKPYNVADLVALVARLLTRLGEESLSEA